MNLTFSDHQIKLKDGRSLGFAQYGDPNGKPVLHFHGWCSSRLEGSLPAIQKAASTLGVRLIVVERPGMGLSTFQPRRSILDWHKDVSEIADALSLERFGLVGYSSGGPYVAACALQIPERLTGAALLASDPPYDAPEIDPHVEKQVRQYNSISNKMPWLFWAMLALSFRQSKGASVEKLIASFFSGELPGRDKDALSSPEVSAWFMAMVAEGARLGARGPAWDWTLSARPWGFRLQDIAFPIHLFHGEADSLNPVAFGRYLAGKLPECTPKFFPQEGHISLVCNHYQEILAAVV